MVHLKNSKFSEHNAMEYVDSWAKVWSETVQNLACVRCSSFPVASPLFIFIAQDHQHHNSGTRSIKSTTLMVLVPESNKYSVKK